MRLRGTLALLLLAALIGGCGASSATGRGSSGKPAKGARITLPPAKPSAAFKGLSLAPMTVQATPPPAGGLPSGVLDVSLATPSLGVAVTGGFMIALDTGGLRTEAPGQVFLTTDGGHRWQEVWQEKSADLFWVGRSLRGSTWIASGVTVSSASSTASPLLLTSGDGVHWSAVQPRLRASFNPDGLTSWQWLRFDFVTPSLGFAVPDPRETVMGLQGILRTTDGGRSWSLVPLPGGQPTGGIAFSSQSTGLATGLGPQCSGIWRTTDGGATWNELPGSCQSAGFDAVAYAGTSVAYAGGGQSPKFGGFATLWRSSDGGDTWQKIYEVQKEGPISALYTAGDAIWASVGACVMGQSAPCGGAAIVSHDGGLTFTQMPHGANHLTVPTASVAMGVAGLFAGVVWRTDDGGAQSQVLSSARSIAYQQVTAMGPLDLALSANAGTLFSTDAGASFQPATPDAQGNLPYMPGLVVEPRFTQDGRSVSITVQQGRAPAKTAILPVSVQSADPFAMASPRSGALVAGGSGCTIGGPRDATVYLTADGGGTWRSVASLALAPQHVAYDGRTLAVTGTSDATCGPVLAISRQGGRDFRLMELPKSLGFCAVSVAQGTIWLLCNPTDASSTDSDILRSTNGGRTWQGYRAKRFYLQSIAALTPDRAFFTANGGFWQTGDGGRTLKEVWPAIPSSWR